MDLYHTGREVSIALGPFANKHWMDAEDLLQRIRLACGFGPLGMVLLVAARGGSRWGEV